MDGVCLRFYTFEMRKLHGKLVGDRLLERVRVEPLPLFHVRFPVERGRTRAA